MKELLSFAFALLFIACQNQPFSHRAASPAPSVKIPIQATVRAQSESCNIELEKTLDVIKELQDERQPGFYYREASVRSEFDFENGYESLVCVTQMTSSEDFEQAIAEVPSPEPETMALEGWETLTRKWEAESLKACR